MLKFAYSTINWGTDCDLAQAASEIREAGWSAVELYRHSLDWLGLPEDVHSRLSGLEVATVFGGVESPFLVPAQVTVHQRRIDHAAALGATDYGLVGGTRLRRRAPNAAEYRDLAALCEVLAVYGAAKGVAVGYHPHTGCTIETEREIDELLSAAPSAMLCLDVSHVALVDEDPVEQLRRYRSRISYVHVKDWARGHFVELGQGILADRWPAILDVLEEIEFPGWVVVEHSRSDESPAHSAVDNAAFLRRLGRDPAGGGSPAQAQERR